MPVIRVVKPRDLFAMHGQVSFLLNHLSFSLALIALHVIATPTSSTLLIYVVVPSPESPSCSSLYLFRRRPAPGLGHSHTQSGYRGASLTPSALPPSTIASCVCEGERHSCLCLLSYIILGLAYSLVIFIRCPALRDVSRTAYENSSLSLNQLIQNNVL